MGLESVVRPLVSPSTRPVLQPINQVDDQPVTLDGSSARVLELKHTRNYSFSHQLEHEKFRIFDVLRIRNPDDLNGPFLDVEVLTEQRTLSGDGKLRRIKFLKPLSRDNIEQLSTGNVRQDNS